VKYLALGDSYTIGEGVDAGARWPVLLARALHDGGVAIEAPRIIATTGWTTDELSAAIDAAEPLGEWDFVTLLIGVNNQYRGRGLDEYRAQFEALLHRAIAFAGGRCDRVLVLSIPDWSVTRFGAESGRDLAQVSRELDAFNAAARDTSARHGVAFVDITTVSRARGGEPAMQAGDGLHPSAAMHALWLQAALPAAQRLLSDTEPD
jgi:lysophospholipase L1-like esterase